VDWICSHCGEKYARARTRCTSDGHRVVEDLSGLTIGGRYKIRELIGVGGMDSTVWKAWQTGTERTVAIKVLPPADEAAAKRFARGARIAANLTHPNCLVIHDYGASEDGKLYLVMEYLPGQVLSDVIGDDPMPVSDTLHIAEQVLQALEHAHSRRAVHRDLKPDNLFVTRKNEDALHIKILDYGIAKYIEEDPTEPSFTERDPGGLEDLVTEQRQVCGTPQYMAPEQVVGGRVDARTDIYSLGVVLFRMITGRLPFDGKTRYELYQKHLQEAPPTFRAVRDDLDFPPRLELIIQKAMAKNPGQRFQSATEMRRALAEVDLNERRPRVENAPRVAIKATTPQGPKNKGVTVVIDGMDALPEESAEDFAPPTLVFPDAPIQPRKTGTVSIQVAAPSPSSTEPSSSEQAAVAPFGAGGRRPRRRWLVAAVLLGAFLIGVGGVAGLMALLRGNRNPTPPVAAETAPAPADRPVVDEPARPALGDPAPAVVAPGEEPLALPAEPAEATAPEVEVLPEATTARQVAGEALGVLEAPPRAVLERFEVQIDSLPRGATVIVGELALGKTPAITSLPTGSHDVVVVLEGYVSERFQMWVGPEVKPESLRRTLELAPVKRVEPTRPRTTPPTRVVPSEPARVTPPVEVVPTRRPTPTLLDEDEGGGDAGKVRPKIDLLDEVEPSPRKKPTVQILGEDPPAAKPKDAAAKPKDPPAKPKVDLLDE